MFQRARVRTNIQSNSSSALIKCSFITEAKFCDPTRLMQLKSTFVAKLIF